MREPGIYAFYFPHSVRSIFFKGECISNGCVQYSIKQTNRNKYKKTARTIQFAFIMSNHLLTNGNKASHSPMPPENIGSTPVIAIVV